MEKKMEHEMETGMVIRPVLSVVLGKKDYRVVYNPGGVILGLYWCYVGIMENKIENVNVGVIRLGSPACKRCFSCERVCFGP